VHRNKRLSFTNIAFLNVYGSKSVLHPWEIALFGVGVQALLPPIFAGCCTARLITVVSLNISALGLPSRLYGLPNACILRQLFDRSSPCNFRSRSLSSPSLRLLSLPFHFFSTRSQSGSIPASCDPEFMYMPLCRCVPVSFPSLRSNGP
jgi:hypothetical protein